MAPRRRSPSRKKGGSHFLLKLLLVLLLICLGGGYSLYRVPSTRQLVRQYIRLAVDKVRARKTQPAPTTAPEPQVAPEPTITATKPKVTPPPEPELNLPVGTRKPAPTQKEPIIYGKTPYDHLKLGVPGPADTIIDRPGYALGYIEYHEQPAWVVYRLTKEQALTKAAKRVNAENLRLQQNIRIADAITDLCADAMPEYVDDSKGLDVDGRLILWQMGMIAWNVAVTGNREMADAFLGKMRLENKAKKIIRKEIECLIRKKYERYPRICTSVKQVSPVIAPGEVKLKVAIGDTFPEMPVPEFADTPETLSLEQILTKRKELGLSQVKFAAALGVSVKKVSAWEHGKAVPDDATLKKNL